MGIRFRVGAGLLVAVSLITATVIASAQNDVEYQEFATQEFYDVWERTDRPVQEQIVDRTWMWGPGANTGLLQEPYAEADDGFRDVQYTDKSRMEMPWNDADPESPWFITQGLLATELMTGRLQVGDNSFIDFFPAPVRVAGDPDDVFGPTYETMGWFMDADPRSQDNVIIDVITVDGSQFTNPDLAIYNATDEYWIQETGFYVASPFWAFMTSSGPIYEDGILQQGQIVPSPFYAVGFPTTPAFWSWVKVDNVEQNVLIQCFERRCLTYTPDNPEGWEVESGNVGQHYYEWRYEQIGDIDDDPTDDVTDDVADDDVSDDEPADDDPSDDVPPIEEPAHFTVSPSTSTNLVGSSHTITVTVFGDDDEPFQGASVSATVTSGAHAGTNLAPANATTGSNGTATLSYTGSDTGTDEIRVSVVGIDAPRTVAKTWVQAAPAELTLEMFGDDAEPINEVDTTHRVLATVIDQFGDPIGGVSVTFSIDGENDPPQDGHHWTWYPDNGTPDGDTVIDDSTVRDTNSDGVVGFSYRAQNPGEDTIIAEVTGSQDPDPNPALMDTSDKLWVVSCSANVVDGESIQEAVDEASSGDTICVGPGTYEEQVVINIDLTLLGEPGATIEAPDTLESYDVVGESFLQLPIVAAFGGDVEPSSVSGVDFEVGDTGTTIEVNVSGFTINGGNEARPSSTRTSGILFRYANGTITDNEIEDMIGNPSETMGIFIQGDSEVTISDNTVTDHTRTGIVANGPLPASGPAPNVSILNNVITGPEEETNWATNGIQIGRGATGEVIGNTVSNSNHHSTTMPGGIVIYQVTDVVVDGNTVTDNDHGIQVFGESGSEAANISVTNNNVADNEVGIVIIRHVEDVTITGNTVTSNEIGLQVGANADATELEMHSNNISGNTEGVVNGGGGVLNATNNWWGDPIGPHHPTENPASAGDSVSDNVNFDPWSTGPF